MLAEQEDFSEEALAAVNHAFAYMAAKKTSNTIQMLLKLSRLPQKNPNTFENFDFTAMKGKDAERLRSLQSLSVIYAHKNLAFIGPAGTGKTHLAQAFGYECCQRGMKTYFIKMTELRDRFSAARRVGKEASVLDSLVRPSCLIIDEVGHCEFDKENTRLFFDLIDRRYNKNGNFNIVFTMHPQIRRASAVIFGNRNKNALISHPAAANSLDFRTKVGIVEFYDLTDCIMCIPHLHCRPDATQHVPCGFIADFDFLSKRQSRNAALITGDQIHCPEPLFQRQMTAVHNSVCCQRSLMAAFGALITAIAFDEIAMLIAAHRTHEAIGPFDLVKIFSTGFSSAGTVIHRTHLPLTTWFWVIYLCANDKRGISAVQLSTLLEICYESAWNMLRKLRSAIGQRDANDILTGIVELDDGYVGGPGHSGKRGRGTDTPTINCQDK